VRQRLQKAWLSKPAAGAAAFMGFGKGSGKKHHYNA